MNKQLTSKSHPPLSIKTGYLCQGNKTKFQSIFRQGWLICLFYFHDLDNMIMQYIKVPKEKIAKPILKVYNIRRPSYHIQIFIIEYKNYKAINSKGSVHVLGKINRWVKLNRNLKQSNVLLGNLIIRLPVEKDGLLIKQCSELWLSIWRKKFRIPVSNQT